ncbi:hypothetical protein ASPZODRAFT_151119 [Penicilliopsis zonata CBS 506.65]|uniref:glycogenin glucosyltransferase n=1 Tax=Penicilliopsis zonata CBS 506.65 TaxID=1073090 RepID=A0A1L9SK84_9EURO|nr:hypothetical protein ASPZODRAFT_151119 [Penicilliopsis zonata CBS 506.65]OJJ47649.1 hypothetical protein ASPZODRAFT_151119 [Penicilliopsis zonata CBS 506.65]
MRPQRLAVLLVIAILAGLSIVLLRRQNEQEEPPEELLAGLQPPSSSFNDAPPVGANTPSSSLSSGLDRQHPISKLIRNAGREFDALRAGQSRTLADAVKEYRRRYQMHPPPHFDKWFEFAQKRGVKLIDEYDTIYHALLPFWALEPRIIRERAREAIGFDNAMIGLLVRDGKVTFVDGGGDGRLWQREATAGMMEKFVEFLPDMDLVFNTHDEPRVIVPSDDLGRLVRKAQEQAIPAAAANTAPTKKWSARPSDMNRGDRIDEVRTTRFNRFAHQPTWTNSRASCPADSPARSLDENTPDQTDVFAYGDLGFLYNTTAYSDICFSPSLQRTFGFFDRPNAFDVVHDLFPVFSQSKISSFQDILYPSPWYWADKVPYDEEKDVSWEEKGEKMYWRGSTTGGFSRSGGWRRQHRQLLVQHINAPGSVNILAKNGEGYWETKEVRRRDYGNYFDVKFTFIGQCDPDDCAAQEEFFEVVEPAGQQDAWAYKHLVDIDGNAFSGRYYAFLLSNSLVYKVAIFREWHDEWLKPWVHFVPLSLGGSEHVEAIRYFALEDEARDRFWNLSKTPNGLAHRFLTLRNGVKLHYLASEVAGPTTENKPLVIFIHGFPDSCALWRYVLDSSSSSSLRDAAVLIALDLPGYGGSDSLDRYSATNVLESVTEFVLSVRAMYGIDSDEADVLVHRKRRTIIVAHDWGCVISMRLAAEAPQLADRFILTNGPLPSLVKSNATRLLSSSSKMLKTSWRSPIQSSATLRKALSTIKPILRQSLLSGYMFAFHLPMPLVRYLGVGGNYSLLRGSHKLSYGGRDITIQEAAESMAGTLGPSVEEAKTETAGGETYPDSVRKERALANFEHMTRYYREGAAIGRWRKSLETITGLHAIGDGHEMRRTSSGAGVFDDGPEGVLKANTTILWGRHDKFLEPQLCLDGIADYLVPGSHLVLLPRSGHFTPIERESQVALAKAVEWAVKGEQEDIGATVYDDVISVQPIVNGTPANLWLMNRPDLISTFTKVEIWRQTQFRRIVYIDSDVVALRAPDELFALDVDFAAAPDVGWPDCFNSGVMVLRPNLQDYYALRALADRGISFDGADQGLLNMHFTNWHRLSFTYNCTPSANYQYIPAYKHFQATISLIHFIGAQKPWNQPRQVLPNESPYNQLLGRWWSIYDRHYRAVPDERLAQGDHASVYSLSSQPTSHMVSYHHGSGVKTVSGAHEYQSSVPQRPVSQSTEDRVVHMDVGGQTVHAVSQHSSVLDQTWLPIRNVVAQYVHASEHVTPTDGPNPRPHHHQAPPSHHTENHGAPPSFNAPSVHLDLSGPDSTNLSGSVPHTQEPPPHPASSPAAESPCFEPPKTEWDASREPPPLHSKPEGIALEKQTYTMSEDIQLFQPPPSYPEAPKNMYYNVPVEKPEPQRISQLFPWENRAPKATRVFLDDVKAYDSSSSSIVDSNNPAKGPVESRQTLATELASGIYDAGLSEAGLSESWQTYSRMNAWDEVPEIQRYIQSVQQARKGHVQVISSSSSAAGAEGTTGLGIRVTDFPDETERPSLPVTPAPRRRSSAWDGVDEQEEDQQQYQRQHLPAAQGVPNQADWVGFTVDNPLARLEELQRRLQKLQAVDR